MAQKNLIRLKCTECKRINYFSRKNKKTTQRKIEYKKHCPWCLKHTIHKEAKK